MSSSYPPELRRALERLFALQTFGIKLGLDQTRALLERFGDPHLRFPSIHVAGTNGKGSVCALIASTLQDRGLRVGLYASPHLVRFDERVRVNGRPIDTATLATYAAEMLPVIEELGCTFFEGTTAIGFRHFAEQEVDVAVIETGMGGRLDSTNVVDPLVSVITSIGFDHMRHLGPTLEAIAGEKAGIIKPGRPAVIGPVLPRLREIFVERAGEVGAPISFVDDRCRGVIRSVELDGMLTNMVVDTEELDGLRVGLVGRHQIDNARTALVALAEVAARFAIDIGAIRRGFADVQRATGIRGRFEKIRSRPDVILDVAHNVDGARVLVDSLRMIGVADRSVEVVYGAVEEKEIGGILETLAPITRRLHAVRAESHRSLAAEEIAVQGREIGIDVVNDGSVARGVRSAIRAASEEGLVLICGSFYVVGQAIEYLEGEHPLDEELVVDRPSGGRRYPPPQQNDTMDRADMPVAVPAAGDHAVDTRRITIKEWSATEQPRERLATLGASSLTDAELLAILLRTGTKSEDVLQISRNLINRFESLSRLAERDIRELQNIAGIGPTKAATLAAAFEIARRIQSGAFTGKVAVEGPEDVARYFIPKLRGLKKEQFHVVVLDTANRIVRTELVSEGNLNSSIVHPREVFRAAIIECAAAVIGLHNHPSGNPTASREDIAITRQLAEAGRIIGIPLHDHLIIAGDDYVSMADKGYV